MGDKDWMCRTVKRYPVEDLTITQDGIDLIKYFEGFRENAYPDPATGAEPITIGYGFTKGVKLGDKITREEAEERLKEELEEYEGYVRQYVEVPLTAYEFSALTSLCYNIGPNNFRSSTLVDKLNLKNYHQAADEIIKWRMANGRVMAGLVKRRGAEQLLFEGENWKDIL